jgi:subtilisin family serine protease
MGARYPRSRALPATAAIVAAVVGVVPSTAAATFGSKGRTSIREKPVVVAVIDSGADLTHPAFAGHLWTNKGEIAGNGVDDDHDGIVDDVHGASMVGGDGNPVDSEGHGSLVAGLISSNPARASGYPGGMAPRAKLMILKVDRPDGTTDIVAAARAVTYAVAHGAKIINISWGGRFDSAPLERALARASAAGVLLVAAAGNDGGDLTNFYPADYALPTMISVASTCRDLSSLADFSNYDKLTVDIAAPGCSIVGPGKQDGTFWTSEGTSFSAPEVAGAAARLWTEHPRLTAVALRRALLAGASTSPALDGRVWSGGSLSLGGAEAALRSPDGTPPAAFRVLSPADGSIQSDGTTATTLTWSRAVDPHLAGYELMLDGAPYTGFASAATSASVVLPAGGHKLGLVAFDRFGNVRASANR